MNVIHVIIIILTVIVAILLIGIVLIQKSKGGGLSSQFGGAGSMMGVRQTNVFLEKGTWWLAGILVLLSIGSAYTIPNKLTTGMRSQQQPVENAAGTNQFATPEVPAIPTGAEAPAQEAPVQAAPAAEGE